VADHYAVEDLVVESLLAGVDHFLVREPLERQVRAFEALVKAAEARAGVRARIEESAERVSRFKELLKVPMPVSADVLAAMLGTDESQSLAQSFAHAAVPSVAGSPVEDA